MKAIDRWRIAASCVLILTYGNVVAQNMVSVDSVTKFQAIPGDIAFDLLGLPGNNIQQPGTVSSFLASLQPEVTIHGELSPAIAISIAPYQMLMGDKLQLIDYIRDPWTRVLSNTQLSLGSAAGLNADSSRDWAIGVKMVFLNSGDGRVDKQKLELLLGEGLEVLHLLRPPATLPPDSVNEALTEARVRINVLIASIVSKKSQQTVAANESALLSYLESKKGVDPVFRLAGEYLKEEIDSGHLERVIRSIAEYKKVEDQINQSDLRPDWNATNLELDAGAVYRAFGSNVRQSAFSKFRIWLNGGFGGGASQFLGQIGFYRQFSLPGQMDSTYLTYAIMYRYGNKDLRIGLGGNGMGGDKGAINLAAEIRLSSMGWIVASFNREFMKGFAPTWSPAIGLKTSSGFWGL
ncbi:MAG TPA: hypothetical protein VMH23_14815 [Bacteroidota bacterium]|nr:hypothetical protein [Bacteroidota bacterium]